VVIKTVGGTERRKFPIDTANFRQNCDRKDYVTLRVCSKIWFCFIFKKKYLFISP